MNSIWNELLSLFQDNDDINDSERLDDESQTQMIKKSKNSSSGKEANLYSRMKKVLTCQRKKALNNKIIQSKQQSHTLTQESTQIINPDRRVIRELLDFVELRHTSEDLICPICLKFIAQANCLTCGHTYCEMCINELTLISKDCLVCQKHIKKNREFGRCRNVDSLVENVLSTMNMQEELMDLHKRKHEVLQFQKDRQAAVYEVGRKIDVRGREHVWCVGVIRRIVVKSDRRLRGILVHYEGFPNSFDEEIPERSDRFARYMHYTGRTGNIYSYELDIPKMIWTEQGTKMITLNGEELNYDLLGVKNDIYAAMVDSDESDAYEEQKEIGQ